MSMAPGVATPILLLTTKTGTVTFIDGLANVGKFTDKETDATAVDVPSNFCGKSKVTTRPILVILTANALVGVEKPQVTLASVVSSC